MAVWGIGRGRIGLVTSLRFKMLDSQPEKSNMGPVWMDVHDFQGFRKSCLGCLARYLSCFRLGRSEITISIFVGGTKKLYDEKSRRFVVASPREVPYFAFSCSFKIFNFQSFLKPLPLCQSEFRESSVH